MNRLKQYQYLLPSLVLLILSCNKSEKTGLEWMMGSWKADMHQNRYYETWKKTPLGGLEGEVVILFEKDTIFKQSMSIFLKDGKWYYETKADNTPVRVYTANTGILPDDSIVFTRESVEFPQKVVYTRLAAGKLAERIEGVEKGHTISYPLVMEKD